MSNAKVHRVRFQLILKFVCPGCREHVSVKFIRLNDLTDMYAAERIGDCNTCKSSAKALGCSRLIIEVPKPAKKCIRKFHKR